MQPLLDGVISYLPSPVDVENRGLDTSSGVEEEIVVPCSADGPLVALAFKLEETRFGQLTYLRLYSGTLNRGDTVLNQTSGKKLRVPRLVRMHSDDMEEVESASAGDVVAMFGADCASMDTFTTQGTQMAMTSMFVPEPVMSLAISCPSKYSANFSKVRLLFLSCLSLLLYAWLDDDFVCRPSLNAVVIDWNLSFCLSNPRDFSATHFPPLSSQSHLQPRSPPLSLPGLSSILRRSVNSAVKTLPSKSRWTRRPRRRWWLAWASCTWRFTSSACCASTKCPSRVARPGYVLSLLSFPLLSPISTGVVAPAAAVAASHAPRLCPAAVTPFGRVQPRLFRLWLMST